MDYDDVNEQEFIKLFCELTGCSEAHARAVYMYLALIRRQENGTQEQPKPQPWDFAVA